MMVTPTDEISLATGLASVQATVAGYDKRFDRVEGKLDDVIERIDVVYPELAALKQQVNAQERTISDLKGDLKEQQDFLRKLFFGFLALVAGVLADAILAGLIHLGR